MSKADRPSVPSTSSLSPKRSRRRWAGMMGSGPRLMPGFCAVAFSTCTATGSPSQRVGSGSVRGRPSKRKSSPLFRPLGTQRTLRPEARLSARAVSSRAASRWASRSNCISAGSRRARVTVVLTMAISATTTSSSISVKPLRSRAGRTRSSAPPLAGTRGDLRAGKPPRASLPRWGAGWTRPRSAARDRTRGTSLLPGANIGVTAFTAGAAVGAEAVHVHLALHAGVGVLVGVAPGVVGQLVQIGLPVWRRGAGGGLVHQCVQALLGTRVALVVELVELERLHQVVDIGAGRRDAGILGAIEHAGHDQGRQDPDDDEHDQQFDQREAAGEGGATHGRKWKR
mmetsp:Transcript_53117/g.124193  ORF Transcript_53117/g.124193 Transcript_53117/m.124193 type:complete len:341 (+) Transcript_53117:1115-2137(+)